MALNWGDFTWSLRRFISLYPDEFPSTGGSTTTETEVDFGEKPVWDATFTVTNTAVTAASKIAVTSSGNPATGRVAGDDAWDGITASAYPSAGSFTIYARANPGPVVGKRNLLYTIS